MKLTAILLLSACLAASASGNAQRITIQESNMPLEKVLQEIKKQSGYDLWYESKLLDQARRVDISVKEATIEQVLNLCFKEQPFTYSIVGKIIVVKSKNSISEMEVIETPPPIDVRGRVVNEKGEPVAGASIKVKGTNKGTSANDNGEFVLSDIDANAILVISGTNIETVEWKVGGKSDLAIVAKIKFTEGDGVTIQMNTGYQQVPKERATGSFERVDNKLLNRAVSSDFISRLQGIVPGLVFDKNAGNNLVGNNLGINIRGISSIIASSQPLIVVDNFPYYADINNINPADIENITVLKDAAAASIWGAAAGNGVIVITTKKGGFNKPTQVSVTSNVTITAKPDFFYYPVMSSSDFIDVEKFLFDQGFYNSTISNTTSRPVLSPVEEILLLQRNGAITPALATARIDSLRLLDVRHDIQDNFYRREVDSRHSFSITGGSTFMNYYVGLGYDNNIASSVGNSYTRYSVTAKNAFRPFKNLLLQTSIIYTQSQRKKNLLDGSSIATLGGRGSLYPYARLLNADGTAGVIPRDYRLAYIDTAGRSLLLDWKYRPLDELRMADNNTALQDMNMNIAATYNFLPWLSAELRYQYDRQFSQVNNYFSPDTYFTRNLINRFSQLTGNTVKYIIPPGGIQDLSDASLVTQSARAQLNVSRQWADRHQLVAIAGAELRQLHAASHSSRQYGFDKEFLTYYNMDFLTQYPIYGNLASAQRISSSINFSDVTNRFVSVYANAAYTFRSKYTLSASARKDASNLFGVSTNLKAVPLWSSGVAWNISKESFYKIQWLPVLRFRATYGYSGNADNSRSAWSTIEYNSAGPLTNLPYATIVNPPNPDLRWEKVGILNFGLDFESANNRISGSVEYYRKRSVDLLASAPTDPTTGFTSLVLNSATIKGRGVDVQLNSINTTGVFQWTTSLIFSYSRNTIARYLRDVGNARTYAGNGNTLNALEGKDVYALFSYRWAGLDPVTGEPQGYLAGQISKNYTAIRNDAMTSLVFNGSAFPVYFGSLRNTINWKNFSLSANILYKLGYWFRRSSISYNGLVNSWAMHSDYALRWQKPGDEQFTSVPAFVYPVNSIRDEFYTYSEVLAERADHIRLKDIRLDYQWDNNKAKHRFIKSAVLYIYADNIGILWRANKHNLDPDYFSSNLPAPRSITTGLKLEF